MAGQNQHVTPDEGGGWKVLGAGNEESTKVTKTKQEAINHARKLAKEQESELFIHGRDGKIQSRDSYGNDPYPPKG